jgi:hypothetical protein
MKFVSKFKLEIPLTCQGCVAPACGILLGLGLLFPVVNPETEFLAVTLVVIIFAANRNTLACHVV